MEQNITKNNFTTLLVNAVKGKRNWYLISTIIILVTTLLVPAILMADSEFFIFFGIVEIFIIAYLNCLIDNNFLHTDNKLAYYLSKPVTMKSLIYINIISNFIFTGFLLILSVISMMFHNMQSEIYQVYLFIVPWLAVGIILSALSSVLTGNTIMAGVMTIFNFVLPFVIYLIIYFIFSIVENIVTGFSANVLMDMFTSTFYKLDYLYFIIYAEKGKFDFVYILILAVLMVFLLFILNKCIHRRKNENTGNFMVFDGYKYFVSVIASLILPAAFTTMSSDSGIVGRIFVSIVLAILSYYIIIAVMEKSFRIPVFSMKLFSVFMVIFIIITGTTVMFADKNKNFVPEAENVKMAYVGNNSWAIREVENYLNGYSDAQSLSDLKYKYNIALFTEKESIQNITDLHREMLNNQNYGFEQDEYYFMSDVVIAYWMEDGSFVIRNYRINEMKNGNSDNGNKNKDEIAEKILNSQELKNMQYGYLYDESYYKDRTFYVNVIKSNTGETLVSNMNLNQLREYLIKDVDKLFVENTNAFNTLILNDIYYRKEAAAIESNVYYLEIRQITENNTEYFQQIYLTEDFKNTKEYLNLK